MNHIDSEIKRKNILAENKSFRWASVLIIVSFIPNSVSVILLTLTLFSFISPLEMLVIVTISFNILVWSIWFSYDLFTSVLISFKSSWSAVQNRKLKRWPKISRDLLIDLLLFMVKWSIKLATFRVFLFLLLPIQHYSKSCLEGESILDLCHNILEVELIGNLWSVLHN